MARTRKDPLERRQEILSNAFGLFQELGYRNVTIDQIAQRCGIARTTLYEYFAGKEEMLLTLAGRIADEVHQFNPSGSTCLERITNLAADFLIRIQHHRAFYLILFEEAPVLSKEVAQKLLSWRAEQFAQVLRLATDGRSAGELHPDIQESDVAFLFQAVIGQRAGELLMLNQQVDPNEEAVRLVQLFWYGIAH